MKCHNLIFYQKVYHKLHIPDPFNADVGNSTTGDPSCIVIVTC
jgi:hypothetical protein